MKNNNYKWKVLITAPYLQMVIEDYRHIFQENQIEIVVPPVKEKMLEEELLSYIGDVDGILCGDDKITENVLGHAPLLKVISKWGTGIDSIDQEAALKRGIPVKNTVNAFTEPVADLTMNYMLSLARGTIELNEKMHQGIWEKRVGTALWECVLGIVGMGNIGKAVAKRAEAFGMKVLYNDIKEIPGFKITPLPQLLKEADFVTLHCDLNPTSRHLINKEKLAIMKPTAFLINASRGPVVEQTALVEALLSKKIAGAGLDVFEDEPLSGDSPLKKMQNVILSPHNANAGRAAWKFVHENTIKNAIDELKKYTAYSVISKKLIDESLASKPIQGTKQLEPLKSLIGKKRLPIILVEDKEVVNDAEIHKETGDFFDCLEGEAVFICGGELVSPWTLNENELRSKTIKGGEQILLKPGDSLWIPAGCAHQHSCRGVARLRVVKIPNGRN
ncbi:MAG: NAD(P)-dependent oxidoreductase [Candidatus Nealsonbacteria bacterium]